MRKASSWSIVSVVQSFDVYRIAQLSAGCMTLLILSACSTLDYHGKCLASTQVQVTVPVDRCCSWDSKGNCTRTCTDLKTGMQTVCTSWACDPGYEQRNHKVQGLRCLPKEK